MHPLTIIQNLNQFYLQKFSYHNNVRPDQSHDQNKMSLDNRCSYSPSLHFSINLITALSIYIIPATAYSSYPDLSLRPASSGYYERSLLAQRFLQPKIFISFSSQNSALIKFNHNHHR